MAYLLGNYYFWQTKALIIAQQPTTPPANLDADMCINTYLDLGIAILWMVILYTVLTTISRMLWRI
jgi:hypothetical protein